MNTLTIAQEIAARINADCARNPRAFYAKAASKAATQQKRLDDAKIARLRRGEVGQDD